MTMVLLDLLLVLLGGLSLGLRLLVLLDQLVHLEEEKISSVSCLVGNTIVDSSPEQTSITVFKNTTRCRNRKKVSRICFCFHTTPPIRSCVFPFINLNIWSY